MIDLLGLYQDTREARHLSKLGELIRPTLEEMAGALGYERAFVALVDSARGVLTAAASIGLPEEPLASLEVHLNQTPGPLVQSLVLGRPMRVDDVLHDSRVTERMRAHYASLGLLSFTAVPLLPGYGVLVASKDRPVSESEVAELVPYAEHLAAMAAEHLEPGPPEDRRDALAAENEWLWRMVDAAQDPILLSNEQIQIVHWNAHAKRLFQVSPEDSPGKRRAIELNNVLLSAALSGFTLDQGAGLARELTLVDPIEGNELLFEVISQPAPNLQSGERGLVSVLKNVTDLRQAASEAERSLADLRVAGEQAQEERDQLTLVLGNVADPIVVTNPEGQIVLMNQPAERLFQAPEVPVSKVTLTMFLANTAKLSSFISEMRLEGGQVRRGELELQDPGEKQPLAMTVTATEVRDELGRVRAVVSVLHDLTEIRELARRRAEQQMMEEANRQRERFISMIAHELGQPLTTIRGYAQLLRRPKLPGHMQEQAHRSILSQSNRMSRLVQDLADASQLATGRFQIRPTAHDLAEIVREQVELAQAGRREHTFQLTAPPDAPALCDHDRIAQVLSNLLINAVKYTPGGEIRVALVVADDDALISISDSGPGIPQERLETIFQPYGRWTAQGAIDPTRGMGLGLYIARGIIEAHGGKMWAESMPGVGTTFYVELPLIAMETPVGY